MNALILKGIGAGLVSVILFLAAAYGGMLGVLLFFFAPLPLFLVALSSGHQAALAGVAAGGLLAAGMAGLNGALIFGFMCGLAPVVLGRFALLSRPMGDVEGATELEWYPVGHLICWTVGMAGGGLLLAAFAFMGQEGGVIGHLEGMVDQLYRQEIERLLAQVDSPMSVDDAQKAMARIVPFSFGLLWTMTALVNGVIAQAILVKAGQNIRPKTRYSDWMLPQFYGLALMIALAGSMMDGTTGTFALSLAMLLLFPYFLLGLAVVHVVTRRFQGREFILASVYLVLLLLGWPALLIILLGLFEQWTGLRTRWVDNARS